MWRLLKRSWKYFTAALSGQIDKRADPKVQIEQAIDEAKRQHARLAQQAAAVFGNQRQIELKLGRTLEEVTQLQASARQALLLAERSAADGDTAKAASYEDAAQAIAVKLIAAEATVADLRKLQEQTEQSSVAARQAVEQNAHNLRQQLAERAKLLSQLEHAKLQERMNEALRTVGELSAPSDVPTLNEVRDKIESRYARALGESELAAGSVEARVLEVEKATFDAAAAVRLESIRAALGSPSGANGAALPDGER